MGLISEPRGAGDGSVAVNLLATMFGQEINLTGDWTTIVWISIITLDTWRPMPFVI